MAGQNADMTLKVGLDLNFFRQELQKASSALAGQPIDINIRFKRDKISNELRLLSNSLSRKKYDVEVKSTSLEALLKQVNAFKQTLAALKKEDISLDVKVESSISGAKAAEARRDIISKITGPKGAIFVPIEVKPPLVKNINAIRKSIKDSLSGIVIEVETKLKGGIAPAGAAGVSGGEAGRAKRPSFLDSPAYQAELTKIAKANAQALAKAAASLPSGRNRQEVERLLQAFQSQNPQGANRSAALGAIRELIARGRYQQGLGFEASLQPLRGQRQTSAARSMPNLNEMLDRIANLTENPRAAQRMLRMMPERRITTDLIGAANKQAEFKQEGLKFLDLKGKAFDPLLKAIAKDFTEYTKSVGTTNPWIGKTGTVLADFLSKGIMSASARELYERVRDPQQAGQLLLPAAGQTSASRMTRQMFEGLPAIQSPQIGMEQAPLSRAAEYLINKARRALELSIGPVSPYAPNPFAGMATTPPRSFFQFGQGPQLPGAPIQAALPPAGTTTNYGGGGFFGYGGVSGTGGGGDGGRGGALAFPGGGMGRSSQLPPGYHMLGTLPTQLERASEFLNQRTLPLTSAIKDLGAEFGHAAQQVLLYGTAYKALAFFTSLPGQAFEAAKNLEVFRNQLDAVTQSTGQFGPSLKFIENSIKELNIPIDSAREGFTRLFASLQPAGFDPGSIQNLFGGITKAAATFGLSADQVDRVFYAFGQMASKGQVMSEELKGQLGDVLPGSVALFAEAAKMSMTEFTKALEDGMFKGDAMKVLLENVAILMNTKFSDAASKASKTLQGQMNAMQNSLQTMYESLQPMVNAFAAVVGPAVQSMIKDATDVIKAFTDNLVIGGEGFNLLTPRAQDFYATLKNIIPSIVSAAQNIGGFISSLSVLVQPLTTVAKLVLDFISIPFVARVALYATIVGTLTGAFQLLVSTGIVQATAAIIRFMSTLSIAQIQGWIASISAAIARIYAMAAAFNAARIAAMALKVTLISFGVGAVLLGLDFVAQRLLNIGSAADDARRKAAGLTDELNRAAEAGDIAAAQTKQQEIETQLQSIEKATAILNRLKGGAQKITQEEYATLQRTGLASGINYMGGVASGGQMQINANLKAAQQGRIKALNEAGQADEAAAEASRVAVNRQRQIDASRQQLKDIPPGAADGKGQSGAEKLANQQQQAAIDAANSQNALNKAITEGRMSLDDQAFQHQLALIDARNSYELAGLNSIQARQEKFQQDLQKLELDRISIIRKAEQDAAKAVADYRAAENTAAAAGGGGGGKGLPSGMTQYITGDPSSPYYQADHGGGNYHEHLAFASRALAEAAYQQLTKAGVQVTEFKGRSPVGRHTPGSAHYAGLAFDVPGAQVPVGQEKQLTAKVQSILGIGGGTGARERRADKAVGKLQVEQTQMATQQEMAARTAIMATNEALKKRSALIKANIDTIFPVAEQRLENDLMKIRNDLQLQGMPQEYIKYQEDLAKANYEMQERIERNKKHTEHYEKALAALQKKQKDGIALTPNETAALKGNAEAIAQNKQELQDLTEAQKAYQIAALESAIATMKNADALKALEETSTRINQAVEGVTGAYSDMFKEIAKGGDSVEALKKAQEALADQALTMFFDFAMQPVEKFFKDQLGAIFGLPSEEAKRKEQLSATEKQLQELKTARETQQKIEGHAAAIRSAAGGPGGAAQSAANALPGASAIVQGIDVPIDQMPAGMQFEESIGAATENLNTATQGVAETVNQTAEKTAEANINWQKALGATVQGIGIAAGSIMGIAAGINQIKEGGTSNTLGGIGSILLSVGGLLGGISSIGGMFKGGGSSSSSIVQGVDIPASALPPGMAFANGGIAPGGFRAFADGGMVSGPTLGLVGEGRYNEAVVPLPNGRAIPVQINGERSARDLMGRNAPGMAQAAPLTLKFESTKINGVEYVSREQLEVAMAETRRASIAGGATRGMNMALDKIQQSPSTRSRIGIR
jgi:tape measure domain-containing protein